MFESILSFFDLARGKELRISEAQRVYWKTNFNRLLHDSNRDEVCGYCDIWAKGGVNDMCWPCWNEMQIRGILERTE